MPVEPMSCPASSIPAGIDASCLDQSCGEGQWLQARTPSTRYLPRSRRAGVLSMVREVNGLARGPRNARGPRTFTAITPIAATTTITATRTAFSHNFTHPPDRIEDYGTAACECQWDSWTKA